MEKAVSEVTDFQMKTVITTHTAECCSQGFAPLSLLSVQQHQQLNFLLRASGLSCLKNMYL